MVSRNPISRVRDISIVGTTESHFVVGLAQHTLGETSMSTNVCWKPEISIFQPWLGLQGYLRFHFLSFPDPFLPVVLIDRVVD